MWHFLCRPSNKRRKSFSPSSRVQKLIGHGRGRRKKENCVRRPFGGIQSGAENIAHTRGGGIKLVMATSCDSEGNDADILDALLSPKLYTKVCRSIHGELGDLFKSPFVCEAVCGAVQYEVQFREKLHRTLLYNHHHGKRTLV